MLECYLHVKHKETYMKVTTFLEFAPQHKILSVSVEHEFAIGDKCNKQCPQWVVMGEIEELPWVAYTKEDGHQTDGFMSFCTSAT